MRTTTFVNGAIIACSIVLQPILGASFMEAIKATPLLDGKSLDGSDISAPFEISAVTDKKQNVFELEDTLRSLATNGRGSINDPRAIGIFAQLNQLAFQGNFYALGFFIRLFQEGTLGGNELPNFSKQPARAEFFNNIKQLISDALDATSQTHKKMILREINSLIVMQSLFDYILQLEHKDREEYNIIISEIIGVLVNKIGKSQSALADKLGISRSSIRRIYHKQALGTNASSPISVGAVLSRHAENLQAFLELTEEQYHQFISELYFAQVAQEQSAEDNAGLRRRKLITAFPGE